MEKFSKIMLLWVSQAIMRLCTTVTFVGTFIITFSLSLRRQVEFKSQSFSDGLTYLKCSWVCIY